MNGRAAETANIGAKSQIAKGINALILQPDWDNSLQKLMEGRKEAALLTRTMCELWILRQMKYEKLSQIELKLH